MFPTSATARQNSELFRSLTRTVKTRTGCTWNKRSSRRKVEIRAAQRRKYARDKCTALYLHPSGQVYGWTKTEILHTATFFGFPGAAGGWFSIALRSPAFHLPRSPLSDPTFAFLFSLFVITIVIDGSILWTWRYSWANGGVYTREGDKRDEILNGKLVLFEFYSQSCITVGYTVFVYCRFLTRVIFLVWNNNWNNRMLYVNFAARIVLWVIL